MWLRAAFLAATLAVASSVCAAAGEANAAVTVAAGSPAGTVSPHPPHSPTVRPNAPVPDPVPTDCAWIVKGYQSNCDGLDPNLLYKDPDWPAACRANNDVLLHTVASKAINDNILIQISYGVGRSSGCRTAAASLYVKDYTGSGACSLTLTRSSDHAVSTAKLTRAGGFWSAETLALFDANVHVFASATCTYRGHTYTGRTSDF